MQIASVYFDEYSRNLRRVLWSEFVDRQIRDRRRAQFRATLVGDPFENRPSPNQTTSANVRAPS